MVTEVPTWVPADLRTIARALDDNRLRLRLPDARAEVEFDQVADNWTIEIANPGMRGPVVVSAKAPGTRVVWHLSDLGPHEVTLGPGLRSVRLVGPTPTNKPARMKLTTNGTKLKLAAAGSYMIDSGPATAGPVTYQAWAEVANPASVIAIGGTAKLTSLRGTGTVQIKKTLELDSLEFDGNVTATTVSVKTLAVRGKLTCNQLVATAVDVDELEVPSAGRAVRRANASSQPAPPVVQVGGTLTARRVRVVGGIGSVSGSRTQLRVGEAIAAASLTDLHVIATGTADSTQPAGPRSTLLEITVNGAATRCSFTGPMGKLSLGTVRGSLAVDDAASVSVTKDCIGHLQVSAGTITLGSLKGSGTLTGTDVTVSGDLTGDGIVLAASGGLRVDGTASNAALLCDANSDQAGVVVGYANRQPTPMDSPQLSTEAVHPAGDNRGRAVGNPKQVIDSCVIIASANVMIRGDIGSSLLHVGGRLQVDGSLDCGTPVDSGLLSRIPKQYRERLAVPPDRGPCTAEELIVAGDLHLGKSQVVRVTSVFSASSVAGGRVALTGKDSVSVAAGLMDTQESAHSIGVVEPPVRSTLTATGLMHLAAGAPSGNTLTFHGPGAFRGDVESALTWKPNANHICHLGGTAAEVHVAACATGDQDPPVLRGVPDHPIRHLDIEGRLRLETDHPDTAPPGRRTPSGGLTPPAPAVVAEFIHMGEGSHLFLGSGRVDIGEVEVRSDASLQQDHDGQPSEFVARIRCPEPNIDADRRNTSTPGPVAPALVVSPGTHIRLEIPKTGADTTSYPVTVPTLHLSGRTRATVAAPLRTVDCSDDSGEVPELAVETQGRIASLSGHFKLSRLHGRLSSIDRRQSGKGWLKHSPDPAQLVQVTATEAGSAPTAGEAPYPDLTGGQLIGVDVTNLTYADIQALSHLYVFDPHGRTLMRHAKDREPKAGKHERAQRLKLLADAVSTQAASGSTRSAVMWASARAHHAVVTNALETIARWAHRAVGYGYRPLPALQTYLFWLVGLTALLMAIDSDPTCGPSGSEAPRFLSGPYGFRDQLVRVLLLPAGILRLELGGATSYAPIGCSAGWHTIVFAITGILLVYLVLALRNFLRTPGGKSHP